MPKHFGPFPITKKISRIVYHLALPASMKVHNIFHVDLLMPYKETPAYSKAHSRPPPVIKEGEEEYEVESILDMRQKGHGHTLQYLVHWKGYHHLDDSWVDQKNLHAPEVLAEFLTSPAGG